MTDADAKARKAAKKARKEADAKRKAPEEVSEAAPVKKQKKDETKEERRARKAEKKARKAAMAAAGAGFGVGGPSLELAPTRQLPPHTRVCAPMVGGSELAFRLLCRRHGCDLCYTPMMYSAKFATDAAYRAAELQTCAEDAPLVAHFCGNDPQTLLAAARLAEPHCCAVDLNLGCPQRIAHSGHFGSYLLGAEDRPLVLSIVRTLATSLRVPVFCKIRLLDELDETVAFCKQLREAGCALIAVHARYRGSATRRRDGPAHLEQVAAIKRVLGASIPILANGNVRTPTDVNANLALTAADGIMSAEGLLDDPAIFERAAAASAVDGGATADGGGGAEDAAYRERRKLTKKLREAERLDEAAASRELTTEEQAKRAQLGAMREALAKLPEPPPPATKGDGGAAARRAAPLRDGAQGQLQLALEYLALAELHPPPLSCVLFHVRRICRDVLTKYQALEELLGVSTVGEARALLRRCADFETGKLCFTFDEGAAKREQEKAARRKREAEVRREFERRMKRKAKRDGLEEDHYIKHGLEPPSADDVKTVRGLAGPERMAWWKERFGQHCLAFHLDGQCARARGCAFLHLEVARKGEENPSWLEEDLQTRAAGSNA